MLIVSHGEVAAALAGREAAVVDLVREAYRRHDAGETSVPHSCFLRFPHAPRDRVIALPAYLGGEAPVAGIKWIASFPGNLDLGRPRASAVLLLNSLVTGEPEALIEASMISAWRTAASAAAAATLLTGGRTVPRALALVGCGLINLTVLRFLAATLPEIAEIRLYDTDPARAAAFAERCAGVAGDRTISVAADLAAALDGMELVSVATTAATPHMELDRCAAGAVVLHISLRDLTPQTILASRNVVDDPDHVCREQTSLHLAEQLTGHRAFIHASIGALLRGTALLPIQPAGRVVFSPFGLGVLDLALAGFVRDRVRAGGGGREVPDFLPGPGAGDPPPVVPAAGSDRAEQGPFSRSDGRPA
jgi:2,3-diaminopropionate biosynthesis protein SbnB